MRMKEKTVSYGTGFIVLLFAYGMLEAEDRAKKKAVEMLLKIPGLLKGIAKM